MALSLCLVLVATGTSTATAENEDSSTRVLVDQPQVAEALTLLDLWVDEQLAYFGAPSVVLGVVYEGELIWSKGYGFADLESKVPATTTTQYRLGSVSKIFTSTAILQLRDRGALSLDDPITRFLPNFTVGNPFPGSPPITLRHLLTHTSGLPREGTFPYWTTHEFPTWPEVEASIASQTLTHPPGENYRYSNLGMAILGAVIHAVSGTTYADFVRENIARPLDMAHTTAAPSKEEIGALAVAYMRRRPDGSRGIHRYYDTGGMASMGNVVSTVEDLARFAAALLDDTSHSDPDADESDLEPGSASAHPGLLDRYTLREMRRPQFVYPSFSGGRGLGFGVGRRDGETVVSHGGWIGGHRSHLMLLPEQKLAVVALTNADDASPSHFSTVAAELVGGALAKSASTVAESDVDRSSWDRYVGLYSDPWDWQYRVLRLGDELVVYEYDYPPGDDPMSSLTHLIPVGGDAFRMPDGDPFIFEFDAEGQVERIQRRSDYIFPVP
ncbi:MAG: beta-lactamase family protein [Thermoanaerobaculia bacterium]|nr:beta-lactamase family protein [Thermoanaerobaculia bacterium]